MPAAAQAQQPSARRRARTAHRRLQCRRSAPAGTGHRAEFRPVRHPGRQRHAAHRRRHAQPAHDRNRPGTYQGTYTIGTHDRIRPDSSVTANLRVGNKLVATRCWRIHRARPGARPNRRGDLAAACRASNLRRARQRRPRPGQRAEIHRVRHAGRQGRVTDRRHARHLLPAGSAPGRVRRPVHDPPRRPHRARRDGDRHHPRQRPLHRRDPGPAAAGGRTRRATGAGERPAARSRRRVPRHGGALLHQLRDRGSGERGQKESSGASARWAAQWSAACWATRSAAATDARRPPWRARSAARWWDAASSAMRARPSATRWWCAMRMARPRRLQYDNDPGFRVGDAVRVNDGVLTRD
jgi:hypothetical protein